VTGRLSLLGVTSEAPWPLDSGGHLRTYHLLRTLATRFDVRLVTPSSGNDHVTRDALERAGVTPRLVAVRSRTPVVEAYKVALAAVRCEPYVLFARHRRRAVAWRLNDEARRHRPDVLYLDHLDSLAYARPRPYAPTVIDMHNVYSSLVSRAAAEACGGIRRHYLSREARLIALMEQRAVEIADTIFAVSDADARHFSELGAARVVVVPNGVDCEAYGRLPPAARTSPPTMLYVGPLAWPPNASAARFLAVEVLPAVHRRLPDARLVIVGKDPSRELLAIAAADNRVHVAGKVPDVTPYFRDAHVMAVPLQAGGGTRLKILEALAAGLPVVSTPIGSEGIDANDGEHLVVADRSVFAQAVVHLLLDPERGRQLAERARGLVRERYDWSVVGRPAGDAVAAAAMRGRTNSATASHRAPHTTLTAL
jgi:glycosyltransferase involved in cell wall biosynthesis